MEFLLASNPPLIGEAWIRMCEWYKESVDRHSPPARVALATILAEREELYRHVPLPGEPIPVEEPLFPLSVDDSILENEYINLFELK